MTDTPFSDALAKLDTMLGPHDHGAVLVRGTKDVAGNIGAKAVVAVKAGDSFELSAEFDWKRGSGYSAAGEVAWKF